MRQKHVYIGTSGNILFIILICVILFSALSYAVTNSVRGGEPGNKAPEDKARISSSELIQYATFMEQSIMKMIVGGTSDTEISFDHALWGHTDYRHASPQSSTNQVFHPAGGGVSWAAPYDGLNDGTPWAITGALRVPEVGLTCADASCSDLVLILPNVNKTVCEKVNSLLGVTGGQESVDLAAVNARFNGTYVAGDILGNEAITPGTRTGCFEGAGGGGAPTGTYHFFHVLLPR